MPGTKSPVIIEGVSGLLEDYSPAEIVEGDLHCVQEEQTHPELCTGHFGKGRIQRRAKIIWRGLQVNRQRRGAERPDYGV